MPSRACIWDYVTVMYREPADPVDPRAWVLRNRWLYAPTELVRDLRSGRWERLSWLGRAAVILGVTAYLLVAVGIVALVLLVFADSSFAARWAPAGPGTFLILFAALMLLAMAWPAVWTAWIATGGPDRATAVLRRERVRVLREAGADLPALLAARRRHWGEEIARWPHKRFNYQRHWIDPVFSVMNLLVVMVFVGAIVPFGGFNLRFIIGGYVFILLNLLWGRRRRAALQRRLLDGLAVSACPDCAYPMLELPGRPEGPDAAHWPGPRRCPECGSPWPLVPPPTPDERRHAVGDRGDLARAAGESLRNVLYAGTKPRDAGQA